MPRSRCSTMMPSEIEPDHEERAELARARPRHAEEARARPRSGSRACARGSRRRRSRAQILASSPGWKEKNPERDPHIGVRVCAQARDDRAGAAAGRRRARRCRCSGTARGSCAAARRCAMAPTSAIAAHASCLRGVRVPPVQVHGDVDAVDHRDAEPGQERRDRQRRTGRRRARRSRSTMCRASDERRQAAAVVRGTSGRSPPSAPSCTRATAEPLIANAKTAGAKLAVALRLRHADALSARRRVSAATSVSPDASAGCRRGTVSRHRVASGSSARRRSTIAVHPRASGPRSCARRSARLNSERSVEQDVGVLVRRRQGDRADVLLDARKITTVSSSAPTKYRVCVQL